MTQNDSLPAVEPADDVPAPARPVASGRPGARGILPRPLVVLLGIVLFIALLTAMRPVAAFIAPVFLGINLVIVVAPLQRWLSTVGIPRIVSALLTALVLFAVLGGLLWLIWWSVASFIREVPQYSGRFEATLDGALIWLEDLGISQDQAMAQLNDVLNPSALAGALAGIAGDVWAVVGFLATLVTALFFLLYDGVGFDRRMRAISTSNPTIAVGLRDFAGGVRRYWVVTTVFGLIVAAFNFVALVALDVPLPLVWAVFSFVTNYIPNIGFVLGIAPPTLMALLANGPVSALIVAILFSVINFVIQSLIQPKFTGDAVGVTPTVSFLSLLAWAYALGPVGALLALPATMLLKTVLVDHNPNLQWVNALIASNPAAKPARPVTRAKSATPVPPVPPQA